jgi:hypothetical protein
MDGRQPKLADIQGRPDIDAACLKLPEDRRSGECAAGELIQSVRGSRNS